MSEIHSEEDFFAVAERQHKEFLERIAEAPEDDIFGLVDAGGAAGARSGNRPWSLVLHLAGWKQGAHNLERGQLRVEMPVSDEDLHRLKVTIKPYDIIHLRGRVASHPIGRIQMVATHFVSRGQLDPELAELAAELRKPVVHTDSELGNFTLDRSLNWFRGEALWQGRSIQLNLCVNSEQQIEDPLLTLKELWKNQEQWSERIGDYAVAKLLERKNGSWLDEDETDISANEFKSRMHLESITVSPNGEFEFWHDDGGLFWGHSIQVCGNLREGLTDVDTPG